MIITAPLAQMIVDSIMPIVQQNINIMNSAGVIIGSGQKSRISTFHQGAKDVLESGNFIEIYPDDTARYPGSLPGLNWPIALGKQIVGVVGISGHPDMVRDTAKLVKMVTELILERENLIEEIQANMQLRDQFIELLLSDKSADNYTQITKMAALLRFDLNHPRLIAVVDISNMLEDALKQYGTLDLVTSRTRENIKQLVEASDLISAKDMVAFSERELVILKHFPLTADSETITEWSLALIQMLKAEFPGDTLTLGVGSLTSSPLELRFSLSEALFAQKANTADASSATTIFDFNILVSYLVTQPGSLETCQTYKQLKELTCTTLNRKYDMKNTINALLKHNLNISATAKALFVHRNTLVFRLEKLKELTGLCPHQFLNHAMLCKLLFG